MINQSCSSPKISKIDKNKAILTVFISNNNSEIYSFHLVPLTSIQRCTVTDEKNQCVDWMIDCAVRDVK